MTVEIKKVENSLPVSALSELLASSLAEEFCQVRRLIDDWHDNTNRFDKPGEVFYIAEADGRAVGIGGRNIDPYLNDKAVLRVRRVYVLPAFRRLSVGRKLMDKIMDIPPDRFKCLTLHAATPAAGKFYESLGFSPTGEEQTTHRIFLSNKRVANKGVEKHAG